MERVLLRKRRHAGRCFAGPTWYRGRYVTCTAAIEDRNVGVGTRLMSDGRPAGRGKTDEIEELPARAHEAITKAARLAEEEARIRADLEQLTRRAADLQARTRRIQQELSEPV